MCRLTFIGLLSYLLHRLNDTNHGLSKVNLIQFSVVQFEKIYLITNNISSLNNQQKGKSPTK